MSDHRWRKSPLSRGGTFEWFFIAAVLLSSAVTLFFLCYTYAASQNSLFYGGKSSSDFFMDFFNVVKYSAGRDPYRCTYYPLSEKAYPPLTYFLLYPFSRLFDYINGFPGDARFTQLGIMSVVIFLMFSCCVLALLLYEMKQGRRLVRFFTVAALFASGISFFSLERANTIYLAVICLAFYVLFYRSKNRVLREFALLALAVSAALKVYPALFGVLLVYEKRWSDALRAALYGAAAVFLPFLFFQGGFSNIPLMLQNAKANTAAYIYNGYVRFGFIASGMAFGFGKSQLTLLAALGAMLCALSLLTAWSLRKRWKTMLLLTCALVCTPANSAVYCGLYLFIPVVLFLNEKEHPPLDWLYLFLILLVLNPVQLSAAGLDLTAVLMNCSLQGIYFLLCAEGVVSVFRRIKGVNAHTPGNPSYENGGF